jgi:signal transduction histidine kinase/CheY-like chemotaxis protein
MAFQKQTIATRLLAGFATVLVCTLVLGAVSIRWMNSLAATTSNILEHPFTILVSIATVRAEILSNQVSLMQLARSDDPAAVRQLADGITDRRAKVDLEVGIVREHFLGDLASVDRLAQALRRYRAVGDQVMALAETGRSAQAVALVDREATPLATSALGDVAAISEFASTRAAQFRLEAGQQATAALRTTLAALLALAALSVLVAILITHSIAGSLRLAYQTVSGLVAGGKTKLLATEAVAAGNLDAEIRILEPLRLDPDSLPKDDLGALMKGMIALSEIQSALTQAFSRMTGALRQAREEERHNQWLQTGMVELDSLMRGEPTLGQLATGVLDFLAAYLEAGAGALYLFQERDQELALAATYATAGQGPAARIRLGQGLIGQAALEGRMITLREVPRNDLAIESALASGTPGTLTALPFTHDGKLIGALELAAFQPFSATSLAFLRQAAEAMAVGFQVNLSRQRVNELLSQSQTQEEELRVQQEELQQSNEELEERAQLLEQQREQIRTKNREVERVSAYKSEFLANMSHELRTPLNSLMILSGILQDNKDGNLTHKQVEYAATIHSAGKDLLELINDILDLAKIEAGRLEYNLEPATPGAICESIERAFRPLAEQKGLAFGTELAPGIPASITTDLQRCQQILKNLVANALKFTAQGSVTLRVYLPGPRENPLQAEAVAFAVSDTGIGIAAGMQEAVFQAFQQADGTTSRKFGGTGLGLAISRQLARGLHGEILLRSEGVGTVVTLYLPAPGALPAVPWPAPALAERLESQVERPEIPTEQPMRSTSSDPVKRVLIVEDDRNEAKSLMALLQERNLEIRMAETGAAAIDLLKADRFDCVVLDLGLSDMSGFDLLERIRQLDQRRIPVIIHSGRELSREDEFRLQHDAESIIIKGAKSPERLRNEVALFLHVLETGLTPDHERMLRSAMDGDAVFQGKKVLIVDDDMRNVFSLSSLLAERQMTILEAENGREALAQLEEHPDTRIVLMDIMMPEMDGYQAIRAIRLDPRFQRLPVIALTAKAMKGDREACMRTGASDYITKPIDQERLLSLLRVWLYQPA